MFVLIVAISLLIQFCYITGQQPKFGDEDWHWGYGSEGEWDTHFAACNGSHESPININTQKVVIDSRLRIQFHNYNEKYYKSTAENNGHTVRVYLHSNPRNDIPYITGEAVNNEKFILDSFHFHWGLNEFNGSEHSINNVKRSAELHLVHWNSKYGNVSNAQNVEDGLVVITVFIETKIIKKNGVEHVIAFNAALVPIVKVLNEIRHYQDHRIIRVPINLKELIPINKTVFFKYQGSLTTPPCSPTVTFIIFLSPIYMTAKQLSEFRQIEGEAIKGVVRILTHNTRDQMPLNDRVIKISNPYISNAKIVN